MSTYLLVNDGLQLTLRDVVGSVGLFLHKGLYVSVEMQSTLENGVQVADGDGGKVHGTLE